MLSLGLREGDKHLCSYTNWLAHTCADTHPHGTYIHTHIYIRPPTQTPPPPTHTHTHTNADIYIHTHTHIYTHCIHIHRENTNYIHTQWSNPAAYTSLPNMHIWLFQQLPTITLIQKLGAGGRLSSKFIGAGAGLRLNELLIGRHNQLQKWVCSQI